MAVYTCSPIFFCEFEEVPPVVLFLHFSQISEHQEKNLQKKEIY